MLVGTDNVITLDKPVVQRPVNGYGRDIVSGGGRVGSEWPHVLKGGG